MYGAPGAGVPGLYCWMMPIASNTLGAGGKLVGMKIVAVPVASVIVDVVELYVTPLMRTSRPSLGSV